MRLSFVVGIWIFSSVNGDAAVKARIMGSSRDLFTKEGYEYGIACIQNYFVA